MSRPSTGGADLGATSGTGSEAALGRRDFLRFAGIGLGAAVGGSVLAGCGGTSSSGQGGTAKASNPKASFGVLRAPTGALAVVAGQHSWFKDAGVDVKFVSFAEGGGPKMVQAMAGGAPDIGLFNLATAVLALGQGTFDLQIVAAPDEPSAALPLLSVPSITEVPQLKGKIVTCPPSGGQFYELNAMLAKYGMSLKDVDYKPLKVGEGQAAFLTGKVDAVISSANGTAFIRKNKPDTVVLFSRDDWAKSPSPKQYANPDILAVSKQTAGAKPDAIKRFIQAYHDKGIDYLMSPKTHDAAVKDIQDYEKSVGAASTDLATTADVIKAIEWYSLKQDRELMTGDLLAQSVNDQLEFWIKQGVVKKMPDVSHAINTSFLS